MNEMLKPEYHILNLGAGVQSTVLYMLACEPDRELFFDCAIFADTQGEPKRVYRHLDWLQQYGKDSGGPHIYIDTKGNLAADLVAGRNSAGHGKKETAKRPGWTRFASIPCFTAANHETRSDDYDPLKQAGRVRRQCTHEYKVSVVQQLIRRVILGLKPRQRVPKTVKIYQYLGITVDEIGRMARIEKRFAQSCKWSTPCFPLVDMAWTRSGCVRFLESKMLPHKVGKSACVFCLAGETQVVTPDGDRSIKDLVGEATLLVPTKNGRFFSEKGKWQKANVLSFGEQELMKINLGRGRSTKEVYATAEHRWVISGEIGFRKTIDLKDGDQLASCMMPALTCSGSPVVPSPFGIAQGFVFGDGSRDLKGNRPASVTIYGEKDKAMLPYFAASRTKKITANGKPAIRIPDLPRSWKDLPSTNESRSFLFGWLAGYFAADGTVPKNGKQAVIYSSEVKNCQFVRAVCYHLGVRASPIVKKSRVGFGVMRDLYSVSILVNDLPDSFWVINHHRERVTQAPSREAGLRGNWSVRSVEVTTRKETVYCAVVPGVERFTLADNLLTGNCPYQDDQTWADMKANDPESFAEAVRVDRALRPQGTRAAEGLDDALYLHRQCIPLDMVDLSNPKPPKLDNFSLFDCVGMCGN